MLGARLGSGDSLGVSGKEKVKIVTLLADLVRERADAAEHGEEGAVRTPQEAAATALYDNVCSPALAL